MNISLPGTGSGDTEDRRGGSVGDGGFSLLRPDEVGVQLTEGFMMEPEASVSALVFHHPDAAYFITGPQDTGRRRGAPWADRWTQGLIHVFAPADCGGRPACGVGGRRQSGAGRCRARTSAATTGPILRVPAPSHRLALPLLACLRPSVR